MILDDIRAPLSDIGKDRMINTAEANVTPFKGAAAETALTKDGFAEAALAKGAIFEGDMADGFLV